MKKCTKQGELGVTTKGINKLSSMHCILYLPIGHSKIERKNWKEKERNKRKKIMMFFKMHQDIFMQSRNCILMYFEEYLFLKCTYRN